MGAKGDKTKELICKEAYKLFAQKGFKEVTMQDICDKTSLSRGGLYRHYHGTDEIFTEIISGQLSIQEQLDNKKSAVEILEYLLDAVKTELLDSENSLSLAIYEYANLGNEELFLQINQQAKDRWNGLIQYGIQTGEFRQVDPNQITDVILYSYQGIRMWSRVIPITEVTADHILDTIRELLIA